jgi:hypothetical protein
MATNNQLNTGSTPLTVAEGGTGDSTLTTAYAPVCAGTTATGVLQAASTGLSTSGYVFTSNGSSALPSFQAPAFTVLSTTLTTAQVKSMSGTPIQLVAAQGAHTLIVVYSCVFEYIFATAAFTGGSAGGNGPIIQYGNTATAGGVHAAISLLDLTAASSGISYGEAFDGVSGFPAVNVGDTSQAINLGLFITNDTANYGGGGTSTLRVTLYYSVLSTTV